MLKILSTLVGKNTASQFLRETRDLRTHAATEGGEIVDLSCIDAGIRELKQLDSGIDEHAWALREYALSNGGQIVDFTCINEGIKHLKSIDV